MRIKMNDYKLLVTKQKTTKYGIILKSLKKVFVQKYMNSNKKISKSNISYSIKSFRLNKFSIILVFISGVILIPFQIAKSEEVFLKCTGKFEINRGKLIKPDWETSYFKINLDGLKSSIDDKGIKIEGSTLIRRDSYIITHRDKSKKTKTRYKINSIHGNYIVDYLQQSRTLIGTCEKGRG